MVDRGYAGVAALVVAVAAAAAAPLGMAACDNTADAGSSFDPHADAGANEDGGPLAGLTAIDVSPASANLLAGDTNQTQAFVAEGHFADGSTRDVTSLVAWKAAPDGLIGMNGPIAQAIGTRGGEATVSAFADSVSGTAQVHVKLVETVLGKDVPAGSAARFDGAADDPSLAPAVVYPLSGQLVPPNLPPPEVQITPAGGADLFELAITGVDLDVRFVSTCAAIPGSSGCAIAPDPAFWSTVTATLGGEDPGSIVVRGAGATAGKVGSSAPIALQVTAEQLGGGLYYFNTNATPPNVPGIYRYDFETSKVGPFFTQGQCAGCHALSSDGSKMLAPICTNERGCGRPLQLAVVDVATKQFVTPPMPVGDSDTQTWSPDNAFYVTTPQCGTYGGANGACATGGTGAMTLISAATNAPVGAIPAGPGAMYPSFSNDGKKLVYARAGTFRGSLNIQKAGLYAMTFDASTSPPTWGAEQTLLPSSGVDFENNYHPSFSPDDQWIVFSRSHCEAGDDPSSTDINGNVCDSYNDMTARSWVIAAGGGPAIELATANGTGRNTVSWPKWAPFKTAYKGGSVFWITVASTRDYGFRAVHTHDAQGNPNSGVTQLWLVAFDPAKAAAGQDPSFAPVWLPFQDVTSSNHIGQWTTKIVGQVN